MNRHGLAEVVDRDWVDSESLDSVHESPQEVFLFPDAVVPMADDTVLSATDLIARVNRSFLQSMPPNVNHVPNTLGNSTATFIGGHNWATVGYMSQFDIKVPWLANCRPIIARPKQLVERIFCGNAECSISRNIITEDSYSSTEGFSIDTTVSVGAEGKIFSASVSTTIGRSWEKTWGRSTSVGVEYTWHLSRNQGCAPSMAHVELQCDVHVDTVHYDSFVWYSGHDLALEGTRNRKGGPYPSGQWCTVITVQDRPLRVDSDWTWVNPTDQPRGRLWKRPASEMRQFRIRGGTIYDDMIIISRRGNEVFGCRRRTALRRTTRGVILPVTEGSNVLPGYVGCVG